MERANACNAEEPSTRSLVCPKGPQYFLIMQTTPTQIDDGGSLKDRQSKSLTDARPGGYLIENAPLWPINHLPSIAERLKTQDNRATEEPSFCVQVKVRDVGYDANYSDSDNSVWIDMQSGEFEECDKDTPGAEQFGYKDRWETVMVAFTEAGAEDYIRQNGHNHKGEKRIYVESFRRCEEMIAIRAFLMTDPAAEIAALKSQVERLTGILNEINNLDGAPDDDVGGDMQSGLHCGVEDRGCSDRYQGADYGWNQGVFRMKEWVLGITEQALAGKEGA